MLAFALVLGLTLTLMPTTAQADHHVTSSDTGFGYTDLTTYSGSGLSCRADGGFSGTGTESNFSTFGESQRLAVFDSRQPGEHFDQFSARGLDGHLKICATVAATNCQGIRGWGGMGRLHREGYFLTTELYQRAVYDLTDISWAPATGHSPFAQVLHMTGRYRGTVYGANGQAEPMGTGTVVIDMVPSLYDRGESHDPCKPWPDKVIPHGIQFVADPPAL